MGQVKDICLVNLVPSKRLQSFFERAIRKLQKLKGEKIGDYLEFGVFNGASVASFYHACKESRVVTRIFGFDAFEGLPAGSENEDEGVWKQGFYTCSFEDMNRCLGRRNVDPREINWVRGWYKDTLNAQTVAQYNFENIGIVFIDCDTYSSSKSVLDFIAPLIKSTMIICLDDWKLNDLDIKGVGEYESFNEFVEANPQLKVEEISSYNRKSKSFLITPV